MGTDREGQQHPEGTSERPCKPNPTRWSFLTRIGQYISPLVTAAATVVIAWFAAAQSCVLSKQLSEMREARIGDQRAWIAPRGAEIVGGIELGQTLEFEVVYENIGQQPAFNVVHKLQASPLEVVLDERGTAFWEKLVLPENGTCQIATTESRAGGGGTAFHGQNHRVSAYVFTGPEGLPNAVLQRQVTVVVQGCFAFQTLGDIDTAPYCVLLYPAKGEAPSQWQFSFCPPKRSTAQ